MIEFLIMLVLISWALFAASLVGLLG